MKSSLLKNKNTVVRIYHNHRVYRRIVHDPRPFNTARFYSRLIKAIKDIFIKAKIGKITCIRIEPYGPSIIEINDIEWAFVEPVYKVIIWYEPFGD